MESESLQLPPDWTELQSENGSYFWHKETNRVQWKFPTKEAKAYRQKKLTHGYVNVNKENDPNKVTYDILVHHNTNGRLPNKSDHSENSGDSVSSTNKEINPLVPTNGEYSQLRPPVPPRDYHLSDRPNSQDSNLSSTSPPPIPTRHYLDEDDDVCLLECTEPIPWTQQLQERVPSPLPDRNYFNEEGHPCLINAARLPSEGKDESPPPLPERTELSEQLMSPSSMHKYLYSSNVSDLDATSTSNPSAVYDEPIIPGGKNTSSAEPVCESLLYDEIKDCWLASELPVLRGQLATRDTTTINQDDANYDEVLTEAQKMLITMATKTPQEQPSNTLRESSRPVPSYDDICAIFTESSIQQPTQIPPPSHPAPRPPPNPKELHSTEARKTLKAPAKKQQEQPSSTLIESSRPVLSYDDVYPIYTEASNQEPIDVPPPSHPAPRPPPGPEELHSTEARKKVTATEKKIQQEQPSSTLIESSYPVPSCGDVYPVYTEPSTQEPVDLPPPSHPAPRPPPSPEELHSTEARKKGTATVTKIQQECPREASRLVPHYDDIDPIYTEPSTEQIPIPNDLHQPSQPIPRPPPGLEKLNSPQSANRCVEAYEVVPLNVTPVLDDSGLMTVNHRNQRERLSRMKTLPDFHGSARPLPPRQKSVKAKHKENDFPDPACLQKSGKLGNQQDDDPSGIESGYHKLSHEHFGANATLPRTGRDPGYSKLDISEQALLMRSGITIKGSLMNDSNSSLTQEFQDLDLEDPVPLILAPNAPTAEIKPRLHTYEDLPMSITGTDNRGGLDERPSSLVWDNTDMLPTQCGGFSNQSPKKATKSPKAHKVTPPITKPQGITDKDFERRLERLDNHFYPELDIPAWPTHGESPQLTRRRPSEIKKAVRSSWNVANSNNDGLPSGWTREVNEQGQVFYWHLPTGKIQYTKPGGVSPSIAKSQSPGDSDGPLSPQNVKPTTFAAEYMGSVEVPEEKLVKGKSVHVVFSSIEELSGDENDPPVHMQLVANLKRCDRVHIQIYNMELKWLSVTDGTVLFIQPINKIRVWGVGKINNRDFGYVSRNPVTQRHQCHVFRCDIAAMGIAQAMFDNHAVKRFSQIPKTLDDLSASDICNDGGQGSVLVSVPLSAVQRNRSVTTLQSENEAKGKEKYKRLEATYIGSLDVTAPHGIGVVNDSVAQLSINKSRWLPVYVDVATSHLRIVDQKTEQVLREHRIRFLSFLGIGQDDRYCGYIVDNGDTQFQFHGFCCAPNSDKLCLALHSACQCRYQRVIDAHLTEGDQGNVDITLCPPRKKSILKRIGSWKSSKSKSHEEETVKPITHSFVVQFLGCEQVSQPRGVDTITEPLTRLTKKTSGIHLVELVVSPGGFTINDPQKKHFASKHITTKRITYCVRIRSHFVFIAKEGGRHFCYIFNESEVDSATIVSSVQELMS